MRKIIQIATICLTGAYERLIKNCFLTVGDRNMARPDSMLSNRIQVFLTTRQRNFIAEGMRYHQLGLSEYIRRIFDQVIADDQMKQEADRIWKGAKQ